VLARDGKLYAAVASGNILRMNAEGTDQEVFANTGGRVLGFDFDAAGYLIAADAIKGLLAISPDRKITMLTDKVGGDPIRYADAVVVASNGKVYLRGCRSMRSAATNAMLSRPRFMHVKRISHM
jgi:sugar lactone lactonase YvrE